MLLLPLKLGVVRNTFHIVDQALLWHQDVSVCFVLLRDCLHSVHLIGFVGIPIHRGFPGWLVRPEQGRSVLLVACSPILVCFMNRQRA